VSPPPGSPARRVLLLALAAAAAVALPSPAVAIALVLAAASWRLGRRVARHVQERRRATELPADGIPLGHDPAGRPVLVPASALGAHTLILGATGSGKTTTLLALLRDQMAHGGAIVAIDLKGSPGFARQLRAAAEGAGRHFRIWTLDGGECWNPLATGNATELKDKLISTERFTEPHYQRAAERYLQQALQVAQATAGERPITLATVVELLEPAALAARSRLLAPARARALRTYLTSLTRDQLSAVRGLHSRLALLTESHVAPLLAPTPGQETIDLRSALASREVVLFSLSSVTYGQLAGQLGTLAVQDLVSATAARLAGQATPTGEQPTPPPPALVAIDEFSAIGSDNVLALLARGREAGVGVVLCTQELADLDRVARGLRDQVLGNTAVKIAHRQDVPESALTVAQLAGTVETWERSYREYRGRFGGRRLEVAGVRAVQRYRVPPQRISELRPGEAVVVVKTPQAHATIARVDARIPGSSSGRSPARPTHPARRPSERSRDDRPRSL
jgi:conjugal transfer pilus assembly protein TraD